jgi:hypothetical protein
MATQSSELTLKLDLGRDAYPLVIRNALDWLDALHWILDSSRPGRFSYERHVAGWTFYVTDPDTAVEFRMRWC